MARRFRDNPPAATLDGTEIIPGEQAGDDIKTTTQGIANRALASVLTGFSAASSTVVTAAHTILQAIGFLQGQVTLRQVVIPFAVAAGTADALTADFSPDAVLVDGGDIRLRAAVANTGAATLAVDGGSALAITKKGGTALAAGDISAAGHELQLRYRSSVPRWELMNPAAGAASGDVVGPASATDSAVALFDGTTGKLIKDSGLSLSGTNTGDQTSIVGITGTLAQFNTAVTDDNFAYLGTAQTFSLAQTFTLAPIFTDAAGTRTALGVGVGAALAGVNTRLLMLPDMNHPLIRGSHMAISTTREYKNLPQAVATFGTSTAATYAGINFNNTVTAATTNSVCQQLINNTDLVCSGAAINGYLIWQTLQVPDASYGAGATGSAIMAGAIGSGATGLIDSTVRVAAGAGNYSAVFNYFTPLSDTNWQFTVRNSAGITTTDTGMAFTATHLYFMMIHAPPGDTVTYWYIGDLTAGTGASGSTAGQHGSTGCYQGLMAKTYDNVARNIRGNDFWALIGGAP